MIPNYVLFSSSIQASIRSLQNEWGELEARRLSWINESTQRKVQEVSLKIIENACYITFVASIALTFTVSPWFLIATPIVAIIATSTELIRERVLGFSTHIKFLDFYEHGVNKSQSTGKSLMNHVKLIQSGFKERRTFLAGIGKLSPQEKRDYANSQNASIQTLKLMGYILSSLDSIQRERREEYLDFIQKAKSSLNDLNMEVTVREAFLNLLNKIEEDPARAYQRFEDIKRVNRAGRNSINMFTILGELATA
ncbi:hypothetical protein [Candidatus Protochlamydia phocaeensis]|uniref:hypothetical protein n=1 Tax=Candidatus Protochlamydia phocaeensis TaxID=1414722 RepID=UPI00083970EE|nr:hypothetical protein [Candidatus Protochlamydia phocaeensis]